MTRPEHFSDAFLSASTLSRSPIVIFKCSHLSAAARRSIEAERKHGGMRLSCAPAVFAREQKQLFSPFVCCLLVVTPLASSERGGRQPKRHQCVTCSSSRTVAWFLNLPPERICVMDGVDCATTACCWGKSPHLIWVVVSSRFANPALDFLLCIYLIETGENAKILLSNHPGSEWTSQLKG